MLKRLLVVFSLAALLVTPVLAKDDSNFGSADSRGKYLEKLQQIKAAARVKKIGDINTRMCKLHKDRITEFSRLVELLQKRLNSLKEVEVRAKTAGRDVSGVDVLVATAQTDIDAVKTAISNLSSQNCPRLTDTNAHTEAQTALDGLNSGFKNINSLLRTARTDVYAVAKALQTAGGSVTHE